MKKQVIKCPECGSTTKYCIRPSEHRINEWHIAREHAKALECRCEEVCIPWIEKYRLVAS